MGKKQKAVVMHGESSHTHVAIGDGVQMLDEAGKGIDLSKMENIPTGMTLSAKKGAEVTHEEHGTVKLPGGDYAIRQVIEQDHDAEESRAVAD